MFSLKMIVHTPIIRVLGMKPPKSTPLRECTSFQPSNVTRRSAIAEGPRDASCQLKSCQLPCNSAETTCTTSPGQLEVMKLDD